MRARKFNDKSVKLEINEQKRVFNVDLYWWYCRCGIVKILLIIKKKEKKPVLFSHGSADLRVNFIDRLTA